MSFTNRQSGTNPFLVEYSSRELRRLAARGKGSGAITPIGIKANGVIKSAHAFVAAHQKKGGSK